MKKGRMKLEDFRAGYTWTQSGEIDWVKVEKQKSSLEKSFAQLKDLPHEKRKKVLDAIGKGFLEIPSAGVFEASDLLSALLRTVLDLITQYGLAEELAPLCQTLEKKASLLEAIARDTEDWLCQRREEHPTWAWGVTEVLVGILEKAQRILEEAVSAA